MQIRANGASPVYLMGVQQFHMFSGDAQLNKRFFCETFL